jgi:uncharacterized membrane protein
MIKVRKTIHINAPVGEVYRFWESFESFPSFIHSIETIQRHDDVRSHWVLRGPLNTRIEFDTVITQRAENQFIQWESSHGRFPVLGQPRSKGEIRLTPADGGRGTIVDVQFGYELPGAVAEMIAGAIRTFGFPNRQFDRGLGEIKACVETRSPCDGA